MEAVQQQRKKSPQCHHGGLFASGRITHRKQPCASRTAHHLHMAIRGFPDPRLLDRFVVDVLGERHYWLNDGCGHRYGRNRILLGKAVQHCSL